MVELAAAVARRGSSTKARLSLVFVKIGLMGCDRGEIGDMTEDDEDAFEARLRAFGTER